MTIAERAALAHQRLRRAAPRAKQRTLDANEIEFAIREHLRWARKIGRSAPEDRVITTLHGGFVPNSYRWRAEADTVEIEGRRAAELKINATRDRARNRPRGAGDTLIHRAIRPEVIRRLRLSGWSIEYVFSGHARARILR